MDKERYNELILLSEQIHEENNKMLMDYFSRKYAQSGEETMNQQLEDWLFVAEETSGYMLGNVIALLAEDSREDAIREFEQNLRRIIAYVVQKQKGQGTPGRLQ